MVVGYVVLKMGSILTFLSASYFFITLKLVVLIIDVCFFLFVYSFNWTNRHVSYTQSFNIPLLFLFSHSIFSEFASVCFTHLEVVSADIVNGLMNVNGLTTLKMTVLMRKLDVSCTNVGVWISVYEKAWRLPYQHRCLNL